MPTPVIRPPQGSATYSLIFLNETPRGGSLGVFQPYPDIFNPTLVPVCWLAHTADPGYRVTFEWSLDYQFVWGYIGSLVPGVFFVAAQRVQADVDAGDGVILEFHDGVYEFVADAAGPVPGRLTIQVDSMGPESVAVGIGMAGHATGVAAAYANLELELEPHAQYWIALGDYAQGEVVDLNTITNLCEVLFPPGVFSMTAILNADHSWTVKPTADVTTSLSEARGGDPNAHMDEP
jgi:rhizosphere induced protein